MVKITKIKVKKLINQADFLKEESRKEWLELIDDLNDKDLKEVYSFFVNSINDEYKHELELIFKAGKGENYMKEIKRISDKFKSEAMKKEEKYLEETEESPEEILKKLDNT